jgi:magnesium transporter
MPLASRSLRRLAYLVPNILLMVVSISVIAAFEDLVLKDVISLAIFLPLVAGVAGSAGNQALAVSIRELSLGVAKTSDTLRVLVKELQVGVVNGLVVGAVVFGVACAMRGDVFLALVVGGALPATVIVSVVLGGTVPLILHRLRIDPAMASGPIITTLIDFFGFFSVLGLAWLMIDILRY